MNRAYLLPLDCVQTTQAHWWLNSTLTCFYHNVSQARRLDLCGPMQKHVCPCGPAASSAHPPRDYPEGFSYAGFSCLSAWTTPLKWTFGRVGWWCLKGDSRHWLGCQIGLTKVWYNKVAFLIFLHGLIMYDTRRLSGWTSNIMLTCTELCSLFSFNHLSELHL